MTVHDQLCNTQGNMRAQVCRPSMKHVDQLLVSYWSCNIWVVNYIPRKFLRNGGKHITDIFHFKLDITETIATSTEFSPPNRNFG